MAKLNCGVYEILNVINGHKYIGSSVGICTRWTKHKRKLEIMAHHNRYLQRAWNKYGKGAFLFRVLVYCDKENNLMFEQLFIDKLNPEYNLSPSAGSLLGFKHSEETKRKVSITSRGRITSDETKIKLALSKIGNTYGRGNKGKKHSAESIREFIAKIKGIPLTEEHRKNISTALTGHVVTEQTRKKISESHIGQKPTEETRIKLSESHKGKTISADTRAKMSAAQKITWTKRRAQGEQCR